MSRHRSSQHAQDWSLVQRAKFCIGGAMKKGFDYYEPE
jgi:hypothetical protein